MTKKEYYFRERIRSFKYAFNGIWQVIRHEANFRIHLFAALLVILLGLYVNISANEWLVIILTIGGVMTTELINSAIENLVDIVHPEHHKKAGLIKDISAGAVLIMAIVAAVIGFVIFIPKLIDLI